MLPRCLVCPAAAGSLTPRPPLTTSGIIADVPNGPPTTSGRKIFSLSDEGRVRGGNGPIDGVPKEKFDFDSTDGAFGRLTGFDSPLKLLMLLGIRFPA